MDKRRLAAEDERGRWRVVGMVGRVKIGEAGSIAQEGEGSGERDEWWEVLIG